jgi:dCTP deaminase
MSFWSSQTLEVRLNQLIAPPDLSAIDCNAVTLHMGHEYYVTPTLELSAPSSHTKILLNDKQPFTVPAGQFAFLQTEESLTVPRDAMAFISMKARMKFRGLVNVSGFHVDPGWTGPLIFAVFNAGPSPVHLEQGMPLFLVWYADLDEASKKCKDKPGPSGIPPELINNITGDLNSFSSISKKFNDANQKLENRIHSIEKDHVRIKMAAGIVVTLLVGLLGYLARAALGNLLASEARPAPEESMPIAEKTIQTGAGAKESLVKGQAKDLAKEKSPPVQPR